MNPLRRHTRQVVLLTFVFTLFLLNATGVFYLRLAPTMQLDWYSTRVTDIVGSFGHGFPWTSAGFLLFFGIGFALCLALPLLRPLPASALVLALATLPLYLGYARPRPPLWIPMEYTLLTILILFVVNVLLKYYAETHARGRLLEVFGRFIPPEVAAALVSDPDRLSLEGEARVLTVLFCDIRGFAAHSERLEPRRLARLLNLYFTAMTDVLHRHGATIDKYIGDCIMAFWGAPLPQPDHARRAVRAALAIQREIARLRPRLEAEGLPDIAVGIGVNTGIMSVGNMGSRYRVAYTVVGDAVNLGARLEQLTRLFDLPIVVAESTRDETPDVLFREIDVVRVKGKDLPVRVFEPICAEEDADTAVRAALAQHADALAAIAQRDWPRAHQLVAQLMAANPDSGYYRLLRQRIDSGRTPETART